MVIDHCTACHFRQTEVVMEISMAIDRQSRSSISRFCREPIRSGNIPYCGVAIFILLLTTMIPESDACFPGGRLIRRLPKTETPLVYKQHVPNVPENSLAASGPREGRIRKFNKRFQELVVNYNPYIVFKDEEGNGEDRIMSVRCKEKLDALAMLVMNFWPGVKLRVTEAWDQEGFHASDSLHYEGRAVDITTSDRDRNKYGLLARLAAQAGFDWVYYENRMHVHASVKSDSVTRHKRSLKCFPGQATVLTDAGIRKPISDLAVGDCVAVVSRNGRQLPVYEPIIAFLHKKRSMNAEFLEIRTSRTGKVFAASAEHLIYVWDDTSNTVNASRDNELPIRATTMRQLVVGDSVLIYGEGESISVEKVIAIRSITGRGVYAPLTPSGTIIVDDVAASCYAAVKSEPLAHFALSPLRLLRKISRSIWTASEQETDGIHWYAEVLLYLAQLLERFGIGEIIDDV